MRLARAVAVAAALLGASALGAAEPEPTGYRGEPYRAPVPATLAGAHVIGPEAARALWLSGKVGFVDVLPRPPRPADLPADTVWRDAPHATIPGALWLPNTGYAELAQPTLDYLLAGLAAATDGDPGSPVVIFCQRDCWMSWNAARRAIEHGYGTVFWFPDGVDGWTFDPPLEPAAPWSP